MGDPKNERQTRIVRELVDMIATVGDAVWSGRLGFDYAVKEYVEGSDSELSRAMREYVTAMRLGDETARVPDPDESSYRESVRRETLRSVAKRIDVPEVGLFVQAVIKSQDERLSIGRTLVDQYEENRLRLWHLSMGNEFPAILGPLAPLQADPTIRNIIVDGPDRVYVMRDDSNFEWEDTDVTFDLPDGVRSLADLVVFAPSNQRLGPGKSVGEVRLPDGSHMIAVLPPTAVDNPYLVIRKGMVAPSITWDNIIKWGAISPQARDYLVSRLRADVGCNILVTGNPFSGKSAVTRLVAKSIPERRRVIVVANASDMLVEHPRRIYLEPDGPDHLSVADLLDVAVKLRPDWLVVPEMSGPEAFRAIQLMGGRYKAVTEMTAFSPEEALSRLEALCLTANPGSGLGEIRTLIASAINLIVHMQSHTLPDYRRKITRIVEVRGVEHDRYILQPLFTYDADQARLLPTRAFEAWEEDTARRITDP